MRPVTLVFFAGLLFLMVGCNSFPVYRDLTVSIEVASVSVSLRRDVDYETTRLPD